MGDNSSRTEPDTAPEATREELVKRMNSVMHLLCKDGCHGRCDECPQDVMGDAIKVLASPEAPAAVDEARICRDGREFVIELATIMGVVDVTADAGESIHVSKIMPLMLERAKEDREHWHSTSPPSLCRVRGEIVDVEFILKRANGVVDRIPPPYSADKKDGAEWMKKAALGALEKLRRELASRMGGKS